MGNPPSNSAVQGVNYRIVPNNTNAKWWLDTGLRRNVFYCIGLCGTLFFNGFDGSLFNGLQTIDAWQDFFDHPTGNLLGLMNSAAFFPPILAPLVAERIANQFGRRWAVWVGCWINIAGAIVNASSVNVGMFIAGRVLMGIGICMGVTIAPTLLHEFAHPRFRAPLGSMYTCIYYIAAVISASACLGSRHIGGNASWRLPCYLQLLGPVFTFCITITIPESPRWLVKHEHQDRALTILAKYHANGDEQDPLVLLEFNEIAESISTEQQNSQVSYKDFLKRENRHRLFLLVVIGIGGNWVGNGIISYYLAPILEQIGVTSTSQQAGLNLGLQVWNLIISTTAATNVDRVGRRPLWLSSTVGMLVSFVIVMGLSGSYAQNHHSATGLAVIPFLFIFFGFYDIAWTPLPNMYTVEIIPFSLRARGQAIYNTVQGCANAINQWINPIILDAIKWKYYGVYIGILTIFSIIIWFYFPETKNLTIEEIAIIFDGDQAGRIREVAEMANAKTGPGNEEAEHIETV